jgi:2-hydroxychromene-2-carboxylate isomerase
MAGSSTADLQVLRPGPVEAGPCFYLDFAVPEAYLAAERILSLMPAPCEWVPIAAGELPAGGWGAWRCAEEREIELSQFERTAFHRGLQPVRWPPELPFDSDFALRAATYAKGAGKTVAFSLAAFRQAYAGGRDLSAQDNVLIAGAACEIHPRALLQGAATRAVANGLARATALAGERGVRSVPAVWVAGEVFHGDAELERAAAAVARTL